MQRWTANQLAWLGVQDAASERDVITIRIGTPAGQIDIMGNVRLDGRTLIAESVHIQGAKPQAVGLVNLRTLAEFVLERIDCDEARIEGAVRTTGANPGHRPRPLRFTRRHRVAP